MTRLLLYISLLCLPLTNYAWQQDSLVVSDTTVITEDYSDDYYSEDTYEQEHNATAPPPAPVYEKKLFGKDFKKRYTDDDFNYVEEKSAPNWAQKLFAWIRGVLKAIFGDGNESQRPGKDSGYSFPVFELLAIVALLVAVYFIARAILQKEGFWIFGRSSKNIATNDLTVENLHEMDFPTLISQAKANNDYRQALRYYYLWLLKKMAAREIIEWNWEKTNTDYYYEIKDSNLRDDFKYLSYVYDYSWYGDFPVDEKSFGKAENAFKKTLNTI